MNELKRRAAEEAVRRVEPGMVVGLGSGSTAAFAVEAIGRRVQEGTLGDLLGVPTSVQTRDLARSLGIPLTTLDEHPCLDVTIDGADEVDPEGNLIKGGGGALLMEKIVAAATRHYVIVIDETKLVRVLGEGFAVPIEVMPFGHRTHFEFVRELGAEPTLRLGPSRDPFVTDGGHYIIDCRFPDGMPDPKRIDRLFHNRPGVLETGLFLSMEPEVVVGRAR